MNKLCSFLCGICVLLFVQPVNAAGNNDIMDWKAGVACIVITPEEPIWMAGYAFRNHPAESKLQDIWAKALVLQDSRGKNCVLITLDLSAIPKRMSDYIRSQLKSKYNLSKAQIIINCSGTYSGPVLSNTLQNLYELNSDEIQKIKTYTGNLSKLILQLVANAFNSLKPAKVFSENGFARFQVNRRNNNEQYLLLQPELKGPNDYSVPVIKVTGKSGNIIAIAFGYACHNNVLNGYKWSGDYAGFAQSEVEKMYPGSIALFFQGAGADQDPLPRHTVPLAKQYGKELAYAVENVLGMKMMQQPSNLSFSYSEIPLPLNPPPSIEKLEVMAKDTSAAYKRRCAINLLKQINKGISPIKSYPYPIQVWKLGEQPIFALGGELVIHYAIVIKELFGSNAFVLGSSNDVMGYIPTSKIIIESNDRSGGYAFYNPTNPKAIAYEGGIFTQLLYGLPGTWASNLEMLILNEVERLAGSIGMHPVVYE